MSDLEKRLESANRTAIAQREFEVIGSIILDFGIVPDLRRLGLSAEIFEHPILRQVFAICEEADDASERVDVVEIKRRLAAKARHIGGAEITEAIVKAAESVPSAPHGVDAARALCDHNQRQEFAAACDAAKRAALAGVTNDGPAIVDRALLRLEESKAASGQTSRVDFATTAKRVIERASNPQRSRLFETGSIGFDHLTGGIEPGNLVILAARPSVGKTTYAMHLARSISARGVAVGVVSLEMGGDSIVSLMLSSTSGIPHDDIKRSRCRSEGATGMLLDAANTLQTAGPIILDAPSGATLYTVRSIVAGMVRRDGARLVIVDYLQLIGGPEDSEYERVSNASRAMKALAQSLDVPLIVLAQLNRSMEHENRPPRLSDLRGSGGIEQDADVVCFLHRPVVDDRLLLEVRCEKNREGSVGVVTYRTDYARRRVIEPPHAFTDHETHFRKGPEPQAYRAASADA